MSVLSSGNPVPRYLRLAQLLRQRIEKGVWVSGEHLPKLEDLMAEFDVARVTVRQAIALLSQEGLVSAVRGKGTIVQALPPRHSSLRLETSLAEMANAYRNDQPTLTLIDEGLAQPARHPGGSGHLVEHYHHLRRVHSREGQRYCVISIYLAEHIFKQASDRFRQETVIPVLMEMPQVKIRQARQTLKISIVDVETSELLGVPMNTAVAEVVRVFTGPKDEILYMAEITYKADFIHFEMELKV
jgi:GntR family transcriptional regulator